MAYNKMTSNPIREIEKITDCLAIAYQHDNIVMELHKVDIVVGIAKNSDAYAEPENTLLEVSGKLLKVYKNLDATNIMTIRFLTPKKGILEGDFVVKPRSIHDSADRLYFELSGALITL